jgi:hypothetical protein
MKRAVPYPPLPQENPASPQGGVFATSRSTKPFSTSRAVVRKQMLPSLQMAMAGAPMLAIILDAIYGHFIEASRPGMTRQGARS